MEKYEKVKLDSDFPLKFNVIDIEKGRGGIIDKHWHRSVELIVPLKGKIYAWTSGKTVEVDEGEILIINSREIHAVGGGVTESYKGYMMQVGYSFLIKCFNDMDSIYFKQIESPEVKKEVLDLIENIKNNYEKEDEHKKLAIVGNLLLIIHILLSYQKKVRQDGILIESDKNKKRLINITEYIEKNYKENITVKMLADEFNLSYGYFVRLFKKNFNVTVKQYITNIRISKAKEEIINTDYSIVQIALDNGFPNIQSFYKEFNKTYGITPAKFRKMSQINNKKGTR